MVVITFIHGDVYKNVSVKKKKNKRLGIPIVARDSMKDEQMNIVETALVNDGDEGPISQMNKEKQLKLTALTGNA